MEQTTATPRVAFVTRAFPDLVVIVNAHYTENVSTRHAFVTNSKGTRATCAKSQAVLDGPEIAVTMVLATKPICSARAILPGEGPRATFQTVLGPPTVTVVALVSHLRETMNRPNVIVLKDGWVWPVSCLVNMEHRLVIIFACATCATMGLPVTRYAQITAHFALMGNVTADATDGGVNIVRKKDALDVRKTAPDMVNVCPRHKRVSAIQAGLVSFTTFLVCPN